MVRKRFHVYVNGNEEKVSSSLFGAQLACVCLNDTGIPASSLSIVDDDGVSYDLVACS